MKSLVNYEKIANDLFVKYNLTDWKFVLDTIPSNKRLGQCRYSKKEIGLSKKSALILSFDENMNTILHEIAHVLTIGHGHDEVWKEKCREIGCKDERCADVNLDILAKYKGICPTCGHLIYSGRKIRYIHTQCSNKEYIRTGNSNWKNHIYVWSKNNSNVL